jgi:outer membrane immunogenic protein
MRSKIVSLLAAAFSLGIVQAASAADMPVKAPMVAPAPLITWTGFYVGVNVGADWARDVVSPTVADGGTFPRSNTLSKSSWFGGGTLGYNYQMGSFVFGLEGDLGEMNISTSSPDLLGGTEVDFINNGLYGDVTGRFGYAFDSILVYAKGGFAFFDGRANTTTGLAGFTGASTGTFIGWTLGGGVEYKIARDWSIKAEYLHFDFGSKNATLTVGGGVFSYNNDLTVDTVKVGINYLFH